jgi:hypothetical protein
MKLLVTGPAWACEHFPLMLQAGGPLKCTVRVKRNVCTRTLKRYFTAVEEERLRRAVPAQPWYSAVKVCPRAGYGAHCNGN